MASEVRVGGRSNVLLGVLIGSFPLILAPAPVGTGPVRVAWVVLMFGLVGLAITRSARMGLSAGPAGVVVRNLGRDHHVPWDDVVAIEAGPSDNVTGMVSTIVIRRADGTELVGRGASSYSRRAVQRWRDELDAARPGGR